MTAIGIESYKRPRAFYSLKPESEAVRVNLLDVTFSNKNLKSSRVLAVERNRCLSAALKFVAFS